MNNKAPEIEKDNIRIWKESFGVLTPTIEEREGQDAIEFEDEYQQEVSKLRIEIKEIVRAYELKDIVTIDDDTNTPPPSPNLLTKEKIQKLMDSNFV